MKEIEIDNNVVRKTPEEIKKGLECCGKGNACRGHCPYDGPENGIKGCTIKLSMDALALINKLEGDNIAKAIVLEQLEREKEALIYDIRNYGFHLCLTCAHCKGKYECAKLGTNGLDHTDDGETVIMRCGQYEWRGITEGKGGNVPEPPKEGQTP